MPLEVKDRIAIGALTVSVLALIPAFVGLAELLVTVQK